MKKYRYLLCFLSLLLTLAGCTKAQPVSAVDAEIKLDLEETAYQLAAAAGFEVTYNADESFLASAYGFDATAATAYKVLFGTMLDANRLAIFEVADDTQRAAMLDVAEKIGDQLKTSFTEDMPTQQAQAESAVIMEKGNYVLFLSGTDAQAGTDAFEALFPAPSSQ